MRRQVGDERGAKATRRGSGTPGPSLHLAVVGMNKAALDLDITLVADSYQNACSCDVGGVEG